MSRIISRARSLLRRTERQRTPEYTFLPALVASTSAFLLAELGGRVTVVLSDMAGLLP
jgi:hypothetical protein